MTLDTLPVVSLVALGLAPGAALSGAYWNAIDGLALISLIAYLGI